jgi:predicted Zn-dependent protease
MSTRSRKEQIEAMLKAEPQDSFLRYALAMEYAGEGEAATAVQRLKELLGDDPTYVPAYLQCGQLLLKQGHSGEARTILERGIDAAMRANDQHAAGEMQGLLLSME